jgi:hypothetical protein
MRLGRRGALAVCATFVVAVAVVTAVLIVGNSKAAENSAVVQDVQETQMMQELKSAGMDVTSLEIVDTRATVSFNLPASSEENALDNALKVQRMMRVAAEAGMDRLEAWRTVGGQSHGSNTALALRHVPAAAPSDESAQAISSWVKQVERQTGMDVTNETLTGGRLDLTFVGSIDLEVLQAAVEAFLNGGFIQSDKGYLTGMTVIAKTPDGDTGFEAAADYVIGNITWAYVSPDFPVECW